MCKHYGICFILSLSIAIAIAGCSSPPSPAGAGLPIVTGSDSSRSSSDSTAASGTNGTPSTETPHVTGTPIKIESSAAPSVSIVTVANAASRTTPTPTPTPTPTLTPAATPTPTPVPAGLHVITPSTSQFVLWGTPITVGWYLSNPPANAKLDISARSVNTNTQLILAADLPVTINGTSTVDTGVLPPNQPFAIDVQVKVGDTVLASASASGQVTVRPPVLSISQPSGNTGIGAGDTLTLAWTGLYLPAPATLEAYLDSNAAVEGNEIPIAAQAIMASSDNLSGSFSISGMALWSNTKLKTGMAYRLGLRVICQAQTIATALASANIQLTEFQGFAVSQPLRKTDILSLEASYNIRWTLQNPPVGSAIRLYLDRDGQFSTTADQIELTSPSGTDPAAGQYSFTASPSVFASQVGRTFYVIARLAGTQPAVPLATATSTGKIQISEGGIEITSPAADLNLAVGDLATARWQFTGNILTQDPAKHKFLHLYACEQPAYDSTSAVELTDRVTGLDVTGGLDSFTFDTCMLTGGKSYYVVGRLFVEDNATEISQSASPGRLVMSPVQVTVTSPLLDTLDNGELTHISVCWRIDGLNLTGCKARILAVNGTVATALADNLTAISPDIREVDASRLAPGTYTLRVEVFKIDAQGKETVFGYGLAPGRIIVRPIILSVLTPAIDTDNMTDLSCINVSWVITNLSQPGCKIRILAVNGTSIAVLADKLDAVTPGGQIIDARKLSPGTYIVRVVLYAYDTYGGENILVSSDAPGKINVGPGYFGPYCLADMAAAPVKGYSPIDGTVFEGFNLGDGAGFEVAGLGDLDNDSCGDFVVFTRFGQEYVVGNAGSGYVVYGDRNISHVDNRTVPNMATMSLNRILGYNPPLHGTIMLLPMDNLADDENGYWTGEFRAFGLPSVSGDEKGDLMIWAPDAIPLKFLYECTGSNLDGSVFVNVTSNPTVFPPPTSLSDVDQSTLDNLTQAIVTSSYPFIDHYQMPRSIPFGIMENSPGGPIYTEPAHVYPQFSLSQLPIFDNTTYSFRNTGVAHLSFGDNRSANQFLPGDTIYLRFLIMPQLRATKFDNQTMTYTWSTSIAWNVVAGIIPGNPTDRYGEMFLITSQRLASYRDQVYDLAKIGSPVEDGASDNQSGYHRSLPPLVHGEADRSEAIFQFTPGTFYGPYLSFIPDVNGNGSPEMALINPTDNVTNYANPARPTRIDAGLVNLISSATRYTSIPTDVGRIAWNPSPDQSGEFNGDPHNVDGSNSRVDIIGPAEDSRIAGVTGLGRFATPNNYARLTDGDIDGDGIQDFVVTCPGVRNAAFKTVGAAYVVCPRKIFGRRVSLIDLNNFNQALPPGDNVSLEVPILGVKILGGKQDPITDLPSPGGNFTNATSTITGTALTTILLTFPNSANCLSDRQAGKIVLAFGQTGLVGDYTLDDVGSYIGAAIKGLVIEGETAGDHFGTKAISVGDVNGDGVDDLLVSAPNASANGKTNCGKVYLIYGKKNIIKKDAATGFTFVDYDGDKKPDGIWSIGALVSTVKQATVFIGEDNDFAISAISAAGDVNNDGLADFLIGSPQANVGTATPSCIKTAAGRAYLILGRSCTLLNP